MIAVAHIQKTENEPLHVANRMAAAIIERMELGGACRIADLRSMGFSLNDVARYWPDASKIAEARKTRPGQKVFSESINSHFGGNDDV